MGEIEIAPDEEGVEVGGLVSHGRCGVRDLGKVLFLYV